MLSLILLALVQQRFVADWTLTLTGDIMLNGVSPRRSPFASIKPLLKKSSVRLANLEIPLTDRGSRTPNKSVNDVRARRQFILRANPGHAKWIADAGFDGVSMGNNHAMDYGATGLRQMQSALDDLGVGYTGAGIDKAFAARVIVKRLPTGLRVGLISALAFSTPRALAACTPAAQDHPGVNTFDPKTAKEWIQNAHRSCDVLIVALHGGVERKRTPSASQRAFAHLCIESGADVVWYHHPHVLEGAVLYKGHPILYSMGNLVSKLPGATAVIQLHFHGTQFSSGTFFPCEIKGGKVMPTLPSQTGRRFRDWMDLCRIARLYPEAPVPGL